ncbi:hypothetical protein [Marinobacter sp.]|mgnify:FL=1|nr:hypothetical protein [Marinobacter sp.]QDP47704.1 MAG: hypothetical protein Tp1102SUR657482_17 [Prokaryotic dsDNA virus sp.]|tara:strand:- start:16262 stop:16411 length:150 start_codon:yes stop_codon:yes gene_type:complete
MLGKYGGMKNKAKKIMRKKKGDLNKDGKMSSYETARSNAIQKNMKKGVA